MNSILIIFIKNPGLGKVKTRLAASIGDEKALMIYEELLKKTLHIASKLKIRKEIWYSEYIDDQDQIDRSEFIKKLQKGTNLGERMSRSFLSAFENGFDKAVIIGSDCPDMTAALIDRAFQSLNKADLVIGPSLDGGYYLLGMKKYHQELFSGIEWSKSSVYETTLQKAENLGLNIGELPVLNDIDTLDDLKKSSMKSLLKV